MTRSAVDIETLLAAFQKLTRDRSGNGSDNGAIHLPLVIALIEPELAVRHGVGHSRPLGSSVCKELALGKGLVFRLVSHVGRAGHRRDQGQGSQPYADDGPISFALRVERQGPGAPCPYDACRTPLQHSTSVTSLLCRLSRNRCVPSRSNFGSFASMHRKKWFREASAKRGALKTGW